MEIVEALIFRDDVRDISPLTIHDEKFLHLSGKGYYHKETEEGSIIIFGQNEFSPFQDITDVMDEESKKLANEFLDKELIDIEAVFIVISDNCDFNILMNYDCCDVDLDLYFKDGYAEFYDEDTDTAGFVFLDQDDADLYEDIQQIQDDFVANNGLEVDFIFKEEYREKLNELVKEIEKYIETENYCKN